MSGEVTVPLPARRQGRHGRHGRAVGADIAPGGGAAAPTPDRIPRVARVLALAHHWQGLLRTGAVLNQADLARLVGVSRARVTQVMCLLLLAPDIQEAVLALPIRASVRGGLTEGALLCIAANPVWALQRQDYWGLLHATHAV